MYYSERCKWILRVQNGPEVKRTERRGFKKKLFEE